MTFKDGFDLRDRERSSWIRRRTWTKVHESEARIRVRCGEGVLLTSEKISLYTNTLA